MISAPGVGGILASGGILDNDILLSFCNMTRRSLKVEEYRMLKNVEGGNRWISTHLIQDTDNEYRIILI